MGISNILDMGIFDMDKYVEYINLGKYDILDFGLSLISEKWRCQIWN